MKEGIRQEVIFFFFFVLVLEGLIRKVTVKSYSSQRGQFEHRNGDAKV